MKNSTLLAAIIAVGTFFYAIGERVKSGIWNYPSISMAIIAIIFAWLTYLTMR